MQFLVEDRQGVLNGRALSDFAWTAEDLISATLAVTSFRDGKKRRIEAVTEDRKDGATALVINRVVLPFAGHDATAVDIQKSAQLVSIEIDAPFRAAIV